MVCFQTKNPYLGKFCRVLLGKSWYIFMTIWSICGPLEIFYVYLVYFWVIRYKFSRFGMLYREKSGNPVQDSYEFRSTDDGSAVCKKVLRMV
jgi:hypothetical protein